MKWLAWVLSLALLAAAAAIAYGSWRWQNDTAALRARLEAARVTPSPPQYSDSELAGLPAPVQRYFRAVLKDGQPVVTAAALTHRGTFNMSEAAEQWKPFTSQQRVITRRPGFDWDARISMFPGVRVHVHDAYVAGAGTLRGAIAGLIPVVDMPDSPELARGELMRFFAEAVWYPTALLPSQGVRWEALDDRSARATMATMETTATMAEGTGSLTLTFGFNGEGLVDTVLADARGRTVNGKAISTPWQGRFWNYAMQGGMRVPMEGEVAWLLPEGAKPYWRGAITAVNYEFAK
jgi:hypothetical protein